MSVPEDIKLTEDRSFEWNEVGDIALVSGKEAIIQDVVVHLFNESYASMGRGLTANFIVEFEGDIQYALKQSDYVSGPYDVEITSVEDDTVEVYVETAEDEYIINTNATN